ncbi:MAG: hypothetical protein A3J46_06470 [Candidatus Yanofskybacteria bacterium RIFCSPHIGHO2_02_FULL_41_11]|uniref:Uncharacterized protein n=1 Tax=Candidatus Yanofskybacteria bacterium RIFCSPHIGHO2_02_FULL_41_11 TaxID=1802675 RepID=A0A1F8F6P4_9BACT|nr:MAG: hypothetical protein A3J46_06470 [Candidatus Yanofskybacteria bacterium RIFCSPHIGHO2_02_FULL_41_11]
MNEAQQQLADRLGELLAESTLDNEIKSLFLEKIESIPEHLLFRLKDALEMEQAEVENIAFEIEMFLKEQDVNWKNTVEEQKKAANTIADAWVEKLK